MKMNTAIELKLRHIFEYLIGCRLANFHVEPIFQMFDRAMVDYSTIIRGLFHQDSRGQYEDGEAFAKFISYEAPSAVIYVAPHPWKANEFLVHPPAFFFDDGNPSSIHLVTLNQPITVTKDNLFSGLVTEKADSNFVIKGSSSVPLRCFFWLTQADHPGAAGEHQGDYTIYLHRFYDRTNVGNALQYIGITKRGWTARFRQHRNEANNGSPYLFHRALRECTSDKFFTKHIVVGAGLSFEAAMDCEEKLVAQHSLNALYANGLNMIPGGFAGIRFLGERGFSGITPRQWEHRGALVREFNAYCSRTGKPNLALSMKWTADDFAAKMILSNPNNLDRERLTKIRLLGEFGMSAREIADKLQLRNGRVSNVLRGSTYSRVH